jgi:hypothetical protein
MSVAAVPDESRSLEAPRIRGAYSGDIPRVTA